MPEILLFNLNRSSLTSIGRINVLRLLRNSSCDSKRPENTDTKRRPTERYIIKWSGGPIKQYIPKTIDLYHTFKDFSMDLYNVKPEAQKKKVGAGQVDCYQEKAATEKKVKDGKGDNKKSFHIERKKILCKRCHPQISIMKYRDPPAWKKKLYEFFGWDLRKRGIGRFVLVPKKQNSIKPCAPVKVPRISTKVANRCKLARQLSEQEDQKLAKDVDKTKLANLKQEPIKHREIKLAVVCKVVNDPKIKSGQKEQPHQPSATNGPSTTEKNHPKVSEQACGIISTGKVSRSVVTPNFKKCKVQTNVTENTIDNRRNIGRAEIIPRTYSDTLINRASPTNVANTQIKRASPTNVANTQIRRIPPTNIDNTKIGWINDETPVPVKRPCSAFDTIRRICGFRPSDEEKDPQKGEREGNKSKVRNNCVSVRCRKFAGKCIPPQQGGPKKEPEITPGSGINPIDIGNSPDQYVCGSGAGGTNLKNKKAKNSDKVHFKYRDHCTRKPGEEAPTDD